MAPMARMLAVAPEIRAPFRVHWYVGADMAGATLATTATAAGPGPPPPRAARPGPRPPWWGPAWAGGGGRRAGVLAAGRGAGAPSRVPGGGGAAGPGAGRAAPAGGGGPASRASRSPESVTDGGMETVSCASLLALLTP